MHSHPLARRRGPVRVSSPASFWYAGRVKSSISVVLFFLLSGFFLSALLGALQRSRRLIGVAVACCAAVVCVIVFLTPVKLPSLNLNFLNGHATTTTTTVGGNGAQSR